MAVTTSLFDSFVESVRDGTPPDWSSDTFAVMLLSPWSGAPSSAAVYRSDISSEASGDGYTTGGLELTGVATSFASGIASVTADNPSWESLAADFGYAVVYKVTGDPSTDPLIGWIDFGTSWSPGGARFTLEWSVDGVIAFGAV